MCFEPKKNGEIGLTIKLGIKLCETLRRSKARPTPQKNSYKDSESKFNCSKDKYYYTTEPSILSSTNRGLMVIGKELPGFITDFFEKTDEEVRIHSPGNGPSKKQKYRLAFCALATPATNSICRARFEKVSPGRYKKKLCPGCFVTPKPLGLYCFKYQ